MTDFTTTNTALRFCLTCGERREVIMEDKLLIALNKHFISLFHVHFCSQSYRSERLCFTASKDSRSVSTRKIVNLTPNRTNFVTYAAIKSCTFIKYHITHCFFFDSIVISFNKRSFFFKLFFRNSSKELFFYGIKAFAAFLFWLGRFGKSIAFIIAAFMDGFT